MPICPSCMCHANVPGDGDPGDPELSLTHKSRSRTLEPISLYFFCKILPQPSPRRANMNRFIASRHAFASSAAPASSRQQLSPQQARILNQLPAYATEQQRNTVMMYNLGALDVLDVDLQVFEGAEPEAAQAVTLIKNRGWFRIRTAKVAVLTKHGPSGVDYGNLYFNPRGGCVTSVFAAMEDEVNLVDAMRAVRRPNHDSDAISLSVMCRLPAGPATCTTATAKATWPWPTGSSSLHTRW